MTRRDAFGTLLAALCAPFVAKVKPEPFDFHYTAADHAQACKAFRWAKPFATFPAPIEAMETIKTNGHEDMLLVVAGGKGYLVDKRGTVTPL